MNVLGVRKMVQLCKKFKSLEVSIMSNFGVRFKREKNGGGGSLSPPPPPPPPPKKKKHNLKEVFSNKTLSICFDMPLLFK